MYPDDKVKYVFGFSLQLSSENFLILVRTERDIMKNVFGSARTVHFILVRFGSILNFLGRFSKNTRISNFMKIGPLGAELLCGDGQTDRLDEADSRFSQFCEGSKECNVFRTSEQLCSSG